MLGSGHYSEEAQLLALPAHVIHSWLKIVSAHLLRCALPALQSVLVSGKPHLGTDRLVRILKAFRQHLGALGCEIRFGARVEDLLVGPGGKAAGVRLAGEQAGRASGHMRSFGGCQCAPLAASGHPPASAGWSGRGAVGAAVTACSLPFYYNPPLPVCPALATLTTCRWLHHRCIPCGPGSGALCPRPVPQPAAAPRADHTQALCHGFQARLDWVGRGDWPLVCRVLCCLPFAMDSGKAWDTVP
jgi:hypothetical protein